MLSLNIIKFIWTCSAVITFAVLQCLILMSYGLATIYTKILFSQLNFS